ncbi:MAG: hypothetical protein KKA73_05615 [Chloroflexi bacterium]|nr:hypothetical protein [Chloroflexota bacterium]MBU1747145.1 hypothetical protein [Chloroflexota bacterium]MBU1880299.1 hypothetical protein [Chloroflexota bacterium]
MTDMQCPFCQEPITATDQAACSRCRATLTLADSPTVPEQALETRVVKLSNSTYLCATWLDDDLTTREVARIMGVTPRRVAHQVQEGLYPGTRVDVEGHRTYRKHGLLIPRRALLPRLKQVRPT